MYKRKEKTKIVSISFQPEIALHLIKGKRLSISSQAKLALHHFKKATKVFFDFITGRDCLSSYEKKMSFHLRKDYLISS